MCALAIPIRKDDKKMRDLHEMDGKWNTVKTCLMRLLYIHIRLCKDDVGEFRT